MRYAEETVVVTPGSGEPPGAVLPPHLIALPGGDWALWRSVVLRGAGFPARRVLDLAAPESAAAADRVLQLEERLETARAAALQALHGALDDLRRDGSWEDKESRRPLMKAMQALTGGKLPRDVQDPACGQTFAAMRAVWEELRSVREGFEEVYAREVARVSQKILTVARNERFHEAVLWQNRHAAETALGELVSKPSQPAAPVARTSRRRQHEELVASYLQRYCVKNDTIGFFGPVAYAHLAHREAPVSIRYGDELLRQRTVFFEVWCIDALAQSLSRNPALRPWLAPRLKSGVQLQGASLRFPSGRLAPLSHAQAVLLARCDGRTIARRLAAELVADPTVPLAAEEDVYRLIEGLCKSLVLTWSLDVPLELHPDRTLAALLARIEPDDLREPAMAALDELRRARRRVSLAAGDPFALDSALREMEETFTRLTGIAPRHNEGQTYAARGLVYEECCRDIEVGFGADLLDRLGPPLSLILRSARWAAGEMRRRIDARLLEIHAQLRQQLGSNAVDCYSFYNNALSSIFLKPERDDAFHEVERELQARWARVMGPLPEGARLVRFSTAELATRMDAVFGEPEPAWTLAHYLSPDVMIAAHGEEAFRRGEFELILGEIHSGNTLLWSCFISQHPDPDEVLRALASDTGDKTVVLHQKLKQNWTQRVNVGLTLPSWYRLQFADEPPAGPDSGRLPVGEVVVEATPERLQARTRDGGVAFPAIDLFSSFVIIECSSMIGALLAPAPHRPRVNIDDVVVSRERWRFTAAELDFAEIQDPDDRFLALRRWARENDLPRFVFYKLSTEPKPCYLDLDSPISGDIFARLVRAGRERGGAKVSVTEMLPGIHQAWLGDSNGNLYTCELRMAAVSR